MELERAAISNSDIIADFGKIIRGPIARLEPKIVILQQRIGTG